MRQAGIVALYKPLAENNYKKINGVVSAAKQFYFLSGFLFLGLDAILIIAYPFIAQNEIADLTFIRMMIIILSVNGIVDYFILGKYRVLLTADQRGYIIYIFQIIGIFITLVASIVLIKMEVSAIIVKGVVAVVYVLRTLAIIIYVRRKYCFLDFKVKPDKAAFSQRYSALLHQIVGMICNNTDVVLLTILLSHNALVEVSVYGVYYLVMNGLYSALNSLSSGLNASFGQVISTGETEVLRKSYSTYELIVFVLTFITFTCMAVLMYPFIGLYSADFADSQIYLRWSLVALFTISAILKSLRLPGLTLIVSAGHFRETQGRAVLEAAINLILSIVLIFKLGMVGVLIGTCASYFYRTTDIVFYSAKHFVKGTLGKSLFRIGRNAVLTCLLVFGGINLCNMTTDSWLVWVMQSVIFGVCATLIFLAVNFVFEPKELKECIERVKHIGKKS